MVGIDVIEIGRVVAANKNNRFIDKVLTTAEKEYLAKKSTVCNNAYSEHDCTLAGFWAAKEAVLKALQLGIVDNLKHIEILHKDNGAPYVKISKQFCQKHNINVSNNINISISHDAGIAICICQIG